MTNPSDPTAPDTAAGLSAQDFSPRHIGPDDDAITSMLATVGYPDMDSLIDAAVPDAIREDTPIGLPCIPDEAEALARLREVADQNRLVTSLIGCGYYGTITPNVILRNVLENPAWYTAYTPYQPEISQGRLEALLNFQTMVTDLTGLEIANASLLDEATAAAEAMAFCQRLSKSKSKAFFVSRDCHPQTIEVVRTRAEPLGFEVIVGDAATELAAHEVFGVLLQYPASTGEVVDHAAAVHGLGLLAEIGLAVLADVLAALGEVDDILVAEVQPHHRELEVGVRAFAEAEHVDIPVAGGFEVGGLDQEMFEVAERHGGFLVGLQLSSR